MSGLVDGVNENIQVKNGQEKYDVKLGIREWKRYPEYKDSGVEWIGEIPKEWRFFQLKFGYDVQLGKMLQSNPSSVNDTLEPYLRAANINWNGVDTTDIKKMWFTSQDKDKYLLESGDLLVSEGGDVGRSTIWNNELQKCYIQNAINRVRAIKNFNTKFLFYWIYFLKQTGVIDILCERATIAHLTAEKLERILTPIIDEKEQFVIADFLDRETSKIDTLIEKKQRLIELLEEKRSALISHAVTKGLDPYAKKKNSGVEWIGEIPENWKIMRLGYLSQVIDPQPDHRAPSLAIGEGFPYVGIRDVNADGSINVETTRKVEESALIKQESSFKIEKGDIVFCKVGTLGFPRHIKPECRIALSATLVLIKTKSSADSRYLRYVLDSEATYTQVDLLSTGSTRSALGIEQIRRMLICIPSLPEQQLIANFLDRETEKIDTFINKISAQIEKLKEYRTALISAAVTGKIDVREEVA